MNFRSVSDLNRTIVKNLYKVPRDIDLVVGVPRSGLLAASLIALYLNLPLTSLDSFLEGKLYGPGRTRKIVAPKTVEECKKILIIDDSISSGETLAGVKNQVESVNDQQRIIYGAVYSTPDAIRKVNLYFEICPLPRMFEWNVMNHRDLKYCCVDIDGVLCQDPSADENDDGPRYLNFLENTQPILLPNHTIGYLVTCRLEKYRAHTAKWLQKHGVKFENLVMMNYPDKETRIASGSHGAYKAKIYKESKSLLFIESDLRQAREIARISGKPVFCLENHEFISTPLFRFGLEIKNIYKRVSYWIYSTLFSR